MSPQLRCFCQTRKCGIQYDPSTGLYGVLVSPRAYKDHQSTDESAKLLRSASKARVRVLGAQETSIARSVEAITVEPAAIAPLPSTVRYKIDGVRKIVSHISEIKDRTETMQSAVTLIGAAPELPVSDVVVRDTLEQYSCIRNSALAQRRMLKLTTTGPYRKDSAVKSLREDTKSDLDALLESINDHKRSWDAVLKQRMAEREANLAQGIIEYDTGMYRKPADLIPPLPLTTTLAAGYHFDRILSGAKPIVQLVILMVVACHVILGLPRRGCHWLFSMVDYILQVTVERVYGTSSVPQYFIDILGGFPRDVRATTNNFHLEAKGTVYATCPKCHTTYAPEYDGDIPKYQERCNARQYRSSC